jgi:Beta-lactamase enzyme family
VSSSSGGIIPWIAEPGGNVRAMRRLLAIVLGAALLAPLGAGAAARWDDDAWPAAARAATQARKDEPRACKGEGANGFGARQVGVLTLFTRSEPRSRTPPFDPPPECPKVAGKRGRDGERTRAGRRNQAARRWRPQVRAAAAWARSRAGTVSFAVRWGRRVEGRGLDRQFVSASVIKAMLMTAYLRSAAVRNRPLDAGDRALLAPMIRWSDNDAASTVRNIVGNEAITRLARAADMSRFVVHPAWGLSLITARDQTRFFLALDRLLPARHRAYALGLLRTIVPEQRWGMARAIPKGWQLCFKGGWGVGIGKVDHQVGLLRRGPHRVAIAVLTVSSPSHAYAAATLEGVSRRLVRGLEPQRRGVVRRSQAFLRPRQ